MQDTHISAQLKQLHTAMINIISVMNRPRNDERLIRAAGVRLDHALFRLLVVIERLGPIGVVELADRFGRDYTTISRQVAKLEGLGLVTRIENSQDRRLRQAMISPQGKAITDRLDAARERMGREILSDWPQEDVAELARLMTRFAQALEREEAAGS